MQLSRDDWARFYESRVNSTYQLYFERRYKPFLDCIKENSVPKGGIDSQIIIDGGCGIGSVSKALWPTHETLGFDISEEVVELAKVNCPQGRFTQFDLTRYAAVTSGNINDTVLVTHGVLEHFDDVMINEILEHNFGSIHYVPLDLYASPSFGDERLLPMEYWRDTFNITEVTTFNNGHDLYFISNGTKRRK